MCTSNTHVQQRLQPPFHLWIARVTPIFSRQPLSLHHLSAQHNLHTRTIPTWYEPSETNLSTWLLHIHLTSYEDGGAVGPRVRALVFYRNIVVVVSMPTWCFFSSFFPTRYFYFSVSPSNNKCMYVLCVCVSLAIYNLTHRHVCEPSCASDLDCLMIWSGPSPLHRLCNFDVFFVLHVVYILYVVYVYMYSMYVCMYVCRLCHCAYHLA